MRTNFARHPRLEYSHVLDERSGPRAILIRHPAIDVLTTDGAASCGQWGAREVDRNGNEFRSRPANVGHATLPDCPLRFLAIAGRIGGEILDADEG